MFDVCLITRRFKIWLYARFKAIVATMPTLVSIEIQLEPDHCYLWWQRNTPISVMTRKTWLHEYIRHITKVFFFLRNIPLTTCNVQHHAGVTCIIVSLFCESNIPLRSAYSSERFTLHCLSVWTVHYAVFIRLNISLRSVNSSEHFSSQCSFVWTFHFAVYIRLNFHFAVLILLNISLRSVHSSEHFTSQCTFVWTFHFAVPIRLNISLRSVYSCEHMKSGR
jgi:hypothetical protein